MASRLNGLVGTLVVALAMASTAQSASAEVVYRGTGTLRAGNVTFKSTALWNVNRWRTGRYTLAGRVAQVSATTPRWNVYRGRATAGFVTLGPLRRWRIYAGTRLVGHTRLVAGRWWVYRGTRRVGTVTASPGGPAAGAGLLLLI